MSKIYNEVIDTFGPSDFIKGLNYNSKSVKLLKIEDDEFNRYATFEVKSERTYETYHVEVSIDKENKYIEECFCSCPQYRSTSSCKHITASILKYEYELFSDNENVNIADYKLELSDEILNKFYVPKSNKIKKELHMEINLLPDEDYVRGSYLQTEYRIGHDKMYTLTNKYYKFQEAYHNHQKLQFSVKFEYDPQNYYLNSEDKKIIDFSETYLRQYRNNQGDVIYKNNLNNFMELLKDRDYQIKYRGPYHGFSKENPLKTTLTKDKDFYTLTIDNFDTLTPLIEGTRYVYDDEKVYQLSNDVAKLYNELYENNIDSLVFKKEDLQKFTGGLLSIIKDNINLAEDITEVVIPTAPIARLYFDFYYSSIECQIKLKYGDKEIDYFSTTPGIVRDNEYESNIVEKISENGFEIDYVNKTVYLEDIDDIGSFLEEGIMALGTEYEVFTSEKIKATQIVKNSSNSVSFSIGKDNILSYNFNLDGINQGELSDILTSLRQRKHYHRLKNGNLINLDKDENLNQIEELADTLGLTNKDILIGKGTIPKYEAIYLDSLKKGKYHKLIKTNNLFDNLISNFYKYKDEEIGLPKEELKTLRDYQLTGVKWLYNIYKTGFGGILADEMGLGKSIQLIYLTKLIIKDNKDAKILIVAPTSLIYNWKKEFDKFGQELNYKVFAETKEQRLNDIENTDANIMITSYGLIRNDYEAYSKYNFNLIAIDEAQNIKNPNAGITKAVKDLKSDIKLALTGTPIENNILELWSIFDFIMPGYLATKDKFQRIYNVKDMDNEKNNLDKLNTQIKYFILRRKKKDVVKDLPEKIENNIYIDLGQKQKEIYAAEVQRTKESLDEMVREEGFTKAKFKILQLLTKLREICVDPSLIFENYKGGSAKIEELLKIVEETKANGHKMLIFTTYKKALDLIIPKLNNIGVSSYYIDGSVPSKKRMELVDKFNNDDTDVFIITLKAGGTGLNLTSATVVIHLDLWWNPQVENQATDRAHRIGQKNKVEVIRLITKGTIEERILELQNKKRKLADMLIDGEGHSENQFSKLTEDDIKMLLSMDKN